MRKILFVLISFIVVSCGENPQYKTTLDKSVMHVELIQRNYEYNQTIVNTGIKVSFENGAIPEGFKTMYQTSMKGISIAMDSLKHYMPILKDLGGNMDSYKDFAVIYGDVVEMVSMLKSSNIEAYNTVVSEKNASIKRKIEDFKLKYNIDTDYLKKK